MSNPYINNLAKSQYLKLNEIYKLAMKHCSSWQKALYKLDRAVFARVKRKFPFSRQEMRGVRVS